MSTLTADSIGYKTDGSETAKPIELADLSVLLRKGKIFSTPKAGGRGGIRTHG